MKITNLLRKNVIKLQSYKPSLTLEQISDETGIPPGNIFKLDSGENAYVEKFQNKKVLQEIPFFVYPDPACNTLREKLADYTGVNKEYIMCGNGSDEIIDLIIRGFIDSGDEMIINPPTFPMYEFYGKLSNAKVISVIRNSNFSLNIKQIMQSISPKTKLVFIDSSGNPTSSVTPIDEIEKILKKNVIVISDEAYFEYCNKSAVFLLNRYPNLIILRTFSKWAGLAGLRIGYAIADPQIINVLNSIKAPYNVNSLAQKVACDVLDKKKIYLKEIRKLLTCRDKFIQKLKLFSLIEVYPSEGAYILFKPKIYAKKLQLFLRKKGFLVKLVNQPLLENCIRMNIAKEREIETFIKLLRRYYEKFPV